MTNPSLQLEVVLQGPAVQGRLSVDDLANLAKELQGTMRRLAKSRPSGVGRFGKQIEQACTLELVGFRPGSVHLDFELASPPVGSETLWGDTGHAAMLSTLDLLEGAETGREGWANGHEGPVLDGLERLTKVLDKGVTDISFRVKGQGGRQVVVTRSARERFHISFAPVPSVGTQTLRGIVWEADWKDHTAELHEQNGSVHTLVFDSDFDEEITQARKRRVCVTGKPGAKLRSLVVERLEILDDLGTEESSPAGFWDRATVADLAMAQEVEAIASFDDLAGEWPAEESLDDFLAFVEKGRA